MSQFVDLSAFQPSQIDWAAYKAWSAQGDGISRVAMRSSYGVGYTDQHFMAYRQGALSAGIDQIYYYHYGYPEYNNPVDEANYQFQVVGPIRSQDRIILDFEEDVAESTPMWALGWLWQQKQNYGKDPGLYSYPDFIARRLQNTGLAIYPLWYADWTFDPSVRPAAPLPWTGYEWLQYADNAQNVPGINAVVDVDIFIGGSTMVPAGWSDDGTTLVAPNGHKVVLGFRDFILNNNWDPNDVPLEEESGVSSVEEYAPSGPGTRQLFLYSELGWTGATGVYRVPVGRELAGCRAERNSLRSGSTALTDIKNYVNAFNKLTIDANS